MALVTLEEIARRLGGGDQETLDGWRARVGGKALGLALLVKVGLPVPPAIVIEAEGYRQALIAGPSFARLPPAVEAEVAGAFRAVRRLSGGPLAVRSSATLEDVKERSFAGQGYTALGVLTPADLKNAVGACYRSLTAPRALAYVQAMISAGGARARGTLGPAAQEQAATGAAMAVVVQAQVFPEVSGVLFTSDPRIMEPGVIVNATYGSGESVAGGRASPDVYAVVRSPGGLRVRGRRPGSKDTEVVYDRRGRRRQRAVPQARREALCLSDRRLLTLAAGALRLEQALGGPQDVEWAIARGRAWFLQSRPATGRPAGGSASREALMNNSGGLPDPWGYNDTLIGDHLWTNVNVGEGLPGVLTPFAWTVADVFFDRAARRVFGVFAEGAPVFGNVYGRMYLNLTGRASVARSLAWILPRGVFERLLTRGWEEIWGSTPESAGLPLIPVSTVRTYLRLPKSAALFLRALWHYYRGFRWFLRVSREEVAAIRARLPRLASDPSSLAETWEEEIEPRLLEAGTMVMFTAAAAAASQKQLSLSWPLLRYGESGALSRIVAGAGELASVAPALELWNLSRLAGRHPEVAAALEGSGRAGSPGWRRAVASAEGGPLFLEAFDGFLDRHGHRSDVEFEYSEPSWREDPTPVVAALRLQIGLPEEAGPVASRRRRLAEAGRELDNIRERLGRRASRLARSLVALHHGNMRRREEARDLLVLWASLGRDFIRAAGDALVAAGFLDEPRQAVFLELPELLAALRDTVSPGSPSAAGLARQAAHLREVRYGFYRGLPDPPSVIRGPLTAGDISAGGYRQRLSLGRDRLGRSVVRGLPASPGRARGVVRLLGTPRESAALRPGEVLVTRTANVGWTVLFPSVAAVVTDVGAPFSHAAIVTRELARPAVVDAKLATAVLRTGDLVLVDGDRGEVTRLLRRRHRAGRLAGGRR